MKQIDDILHRMHLDAFSFFTRGSANEPAGFFRITFDPVIETLLKKPLRDLHFSNAACRFLPPAPIDRFLLPGYVDC